MEEEAEVRSRRRHRRPRLAQRFERVPVHSQADMEQLIAQWGHLLLQKARARLGDPGATRAAVDATLARLRAIPQPNYDHALPYAMSVLRAQCEKVERQNDAAAKRKRLAAVPEDRELGPVTGDLARAVVKLPPRMQEAFMANARGRGPAVQAADEGITKDAARLRLRRARQRLRCMLNGGAGAAPAFAFLRRPVRRLRRMLERWSTSNAQTSMAAALEAAPQLVVPLLLASTIGVSAGMATTSAPIAPLSTWHSASNATALAQVKAEHVEHAGPPGQPRPVTRGSGAGRRLPAVGGLPDRLPQDETLDDSKVVDVEPSPSYDRDHTIFVLATGNGCACPMLFRSTDGGTTWEGSLQAQTGSQVLLPPTYPSDPRIFIGQAASSVQPNWVSPGWGRPFVPLALLPPGRLAMAGSRLFSVGVGVVWSLDKGILAPAISYQGVGQVGVASANDAAYFLMPPKALGAGATLTSGPGLFTCTSTCHFVGLVPLPTVGQEFAVERDTVVAASQGYMVVSHDGGQTFAAVSPAEPDGAVQAVAVSPLSLWAVAGSTTTRLARLSHGSWREISLPEAEAVRAVVVVSGPQVLVLLSGGGVRCTGDDGLTWGVACMSG